VLRYGNETNNYTSLYISIVSYKHVHVYGLAGETGGNRREGDHWGDLGVDGWIILGRISRRWDVYIWTVLGLTRIETVAHACECGNEPSGPVKCGEFLD